jgi:tRNA 2-thiouridine synthesizing protein C
VNKAKKILFVLCKPPYFGAYAYEALDMVMTAAAFDQEVSVLLLDDAVFQLKAKQTPENAKLKDTAGLFAALPIYGIKNIFVETESLQEKGLSLDNLSQAVECIARKNVGVFCRQFDVVM